MSFHFLDGVVNKVESVAQGNKDPGGGVFGFLNKNIAQPVENNAKAFIHPSQIYNPVVSGLGNSVLVNAPKVIAGEITHNPTAVANANARLKQGAADLNKNINNPVFLGTAGGDGVKGTPEAPKPFNFLGDNTSKPTPPAPKVPNIADKLVTTNTPKDAYKALTEAGVDPNIAHSISPAVAHTKDPNVISNIIDRAHTPSPTPQDIMAARTPPAEAQVGGEAPNKFLETIKNSPSTSPEGKAALDGLKETHPSRNTIQLSDTAKAAVDKDPNAALTKVLTAPTPSDADVAEGIHVLTNLQQEAKALRESGDTEGAQAKLDQFHNVSEVMIQRATAGGRYSQAHAIMNSLTPEGIAYKAVKKVQDVREANPKNVARQNKVAGEIQQQLEKPLGQKEVSQTVKDLANEGVKTAENLSTGEKLAKNVEGAAKPPKPSKKTDALVQELTKKVKQEYLDPKAVVKKDPLAVLKATFGRSEEANKAYPEAQQILREKFAGDPHMSAALDKFFGSKLDVPAAHSTIDAAVRNQLKTQGDKVSQIIYKSHIEQGNTVAQTAGQLVHEGFDEKSAQQLAGEVTKRLDKQIADAKVKTLENMAKDSKERVQSTYLDKLNKLSNLGALDKSDYLHLAQAKLNLPHLTPADASKISELSQKLQGLPEGHDKASIVREIANVVHGSVPLTKGQILKGIPGLMRTVVASGDLSFGGRQGLSYLTAHPISFAREWPKQFAYFKEAFKGGDSESFDAMMADIKNHPDYQWLDKSGLAVLDPHAHLFNQREEQFIGTEIADKIPGVRKLIDASSYSYTGFANTLRANQFYSMLELARRGGREPDLQFVKDLAEVINTSTGRGGLGKWGEQHAGALSTALFAPRLIASRVRTVLNPAIYIKADPIVRREAVRQLVALSAFGVGVLAMAKMAGADVETDPRSSDFGKVKIGDTRLDVLGGYTQYIRLGAQLGLGQKVNSTTGAVTEVGKGLAGSRFDILANFFENKANPAVSLGVTELKGKDISGNSIYTPKAQGAQLTQRFIPLLAQDINDLFSHPDSLHGNNAGRVGTAVAGLFGVGTQTYGQQDLPVSGKEANYLKQLQQSGAPKPQVDATKQFFQILKSAPARTTAVDRIHQAIDGGDYQKAQALAQEYNNSVNKHIQDSGWVDKNGKYINADLEKQYNKTQIHLTGASIKAYLKSKEGL